MKRGVQRSGFYLQKFFGSTLDVFGDSVAVSGAGKQGTKDQEVERALQKLYPGKRVTAHCVDSLLHSRRVSTHRQGEVTPRVH